MRNFRLDPIRVTSIWALIGLLSSAGIVSAQQASIRGRVINDATDEAVVGASVMVKGTTVGVLTGSRGEFVLRTRSTSDTLVVASIGYAQQEVALGGRAAVIVRLRSQAIALSELVVVGYGTQRRSDVTGAVASVAADRLQMQPTTNVAETLQGAVAGLTVQTVQSSAEGDFSVLIRGRNSINASNQPLFVVDGIPYGGNISELNPAVIQSIDVLKDASAAAIYGARGSNGVILITTKRGSGGPRISYSGRMAAADAVNVPQMMNAQQFGVFKCEHINGGLPCDQAKVEQTLTASELANFRAGSHTDWVGLATQTGIQQQHTVSFSGGSEQTRYYLSGGLLDNEGVARNDRYRRYNLGLNFEQQMNSWLKLGTNTQLALIDRSGLEASFSDAFVQNPLNSAFNADGTQVIYPWPEDIFFANSLQGLLATDDDNSRRVFTSNHIEITFPFLQGLSYRFNAGVDYEDRQHGRYYGSDTRRGFAIQGDAATDDISRYDWTMENVLRFRRALGKHAFDVTALYSQERRSYENNQLNSSGFPNDVLTYYQANVGQVVRPGYTFRESGLLSQMARLNYTFGDRILGTATVRRDGFSGFGEDHKYGVFPSLALGWNIARESFWPWADQVQALKLRLSWGQNGNEAIRAYQTLAQLGEASYIDGVTTAPGYIPSSLANPDLRWEATTQTNAGIDFGVLHNRVQGSVDFYWSRTHDLLLNRRISSVQGIDSVLQNIGKTANRGVELTLTTRNIEKEGFSWRTTFNIAANRNRVVDLYGDGQDDIGNGWFIGQPIDVNYGYRFDGIWQTTDDIASSAQPTAKPGDVRIKDLNRDGKIDANDRSIIGSLQPNYTAGLTNTLRYGPVSLAVFLNTVQGIIRSNPLLSPTVVGPQVRFNTVVQQWWTAENQINTYPANREGVNPLSVGFYQNSSFVRLQDVNLGVDLPNSLTARFGLENMRLYVNGKNLWTSTKWTGLDPDFGRNHQRDVPLSRTITFGVDVGLGATGSEPGVSGRQDTRGENN